MTINDKQTFVRYVLNLKIKKLTSSILIRNIDNIMYYIFDYIVINCYMNDYLSNNNRISITNKFEVEIYLINDLKINLLINNDVFIVQRVKIDLISQNVQLSNCQNLVASIDTIIKKNSNLKRIIRAKQITSVFVNFIVMIFVIYHDNLSNDRDFLFESQCAQQRLLNTNENVFAHIIDVSLNKIIIRNVNNYVVQLFKKVKLESIVKYTQSNCYNLTFDANFLTTNNWMSQRQQNWFWKTKLNMIVIVAIYVVSFKIDVDNSNIDLTIISFITFFSFTISITTTFSITIFDASFENILSNKIIVYEQTNVVSKLITITKFFSNIWSNQSTIVDISKNQ